MILNKKREKLLNFKASEAKRVREHLVGTVINAVKELLSPVSDFAVSGPIFHAV